jgi:hypothetical protein
METKRTAVFMLCLVLILGIMSIFAVFATTRVGDNEQILYLIILTIISVLTGFLVSQYLAAGQIVRASNDLKTQHAESLKVHAIKVADNVENLSAELQRFASFLEGELQNQYKDASEGYRSRTERIESSIHIIHTLRSVNNASLSEWRNVIPERLTERKSEREEVKIPPVVPIPRPPVKPTGGVA